MAFKVSRTEHAGDKAKGRKGSYWGHRADAKHESARRRRRNDKEAAEEGLVSVNTEPPALHRAYPALGLLGDITKIVARIERIRSNNTVTLPGSGHARDGPCRRELRSRARDPEKITTAWLSAKIQPSVDTQNRPMMDT